MPKPYPHNTPSLKRRAYLISAAVVLLAASIAVLYKGGLPSHPADLGAVHPFAVRTLQGEMLVVDEAMGRPLILNFWATWCVPCRAEMPRLEAASTRYADMGLVVVGINAGQEDPRDAQAFVENYALTFPIVMDTERTLEAAYGVRGVLPTTIFIDANGRIRHIVYGELSDDALREGLGLIGVR